MSEPMSKDHRPRVAAERRGRMRARLIESALAVFAEKGVEASVIQDVIGAAAVAQGTFYNYFRTNEDLLQAVTEELNNELVNAIEGAVRALDDPALRISNGVRIYLRKAAEFPLFGKFVARSGLNLASPNNMIYEYLPPHLEAGFASGRLKRMPVEIALDLIAGFALLAVVRISAGAAAENYPELAAAALLRALGLSYAQAEKIAAQPLAPLAAAEGSLIVRATMRASASSRSDAVT